MKSPATANTRPSTTIGCYDNTMSPPFSLTMTNTTATMHAGATKKSHKKKKNKGRFVLDKEDISEGSFSTLSTHESTLSLSSHTSTSITSSPSSSRKGLSSSYRLLSTTTVFNPNKLPQRSSMKTSIPSSLLQQHQEPKRVIQFDEEVYVRKIRPVKSLIKNSTNSEALAILWFQENEYESIKYKTFKLVSRVNKDTGVASGKKYCTRGLERFLYPEETQVERTQAYDAVLCEQFLQKEENVFNDQIIADGYKQATRRSRTQACRMASDDATTAEKILDTKFKNVKSTPPPSVLEWNKVPQRSRFNRRETMFV